MAKRKAWAIIFCLLMSVPSGLAAGQSMLVRGQSLYAAGRYSQALECLDRAVSDESKNPVAHYYYAMTLSHLSLDEQAAEEYKTAYSLSPAHSQLAKYCQTALQYYYPEAAGPDMKQVIRQTVSDISRQTADSKRRALNEAADNAELHSMAAAEQVRLIRLRAQQQLATIQSNPWGYSFWGNPIYTSFQLWQMGMIGQQTARAHFFRLKDGRLQSRLAMQEGMRRAAFIEEAATNLEQQLLDAETEKGIHLTPLGTNLYVRNYEGHDSPPLLPEALLATQGKLVLPVSPSPQNSNHLSGSAHGYIESTSRAASSVHGRLLHQVNQVGKTSGASQN